MKSHKKRKQCEATARKRYGVAASAGKRSSAAAHQQQEKKR
jgi:hypothetical protein